jgi:hypothetical protein
VVPEHPGGRAAATGPQAGMAKMEKRDKIVVRMEKIIVRMEKFLSEWRKLLSKWRKLLYISGRIGAATSRP